MWKPARAHPAKPDFIGSTSSDSLPSINRTDQRHSWFSKTTAYESMAFPILMRVTQSNPVFRSMFDRSVYRCVRNQNPLQRTLYRRIAINSTFRQIGLLPYTLCGVKRRTIAISLLQRVRVLHVINTNTPLIHPELYAPIWSRIARCRRGTGSQRGSQ